MIELFMSQKNVKIDTIKIDSNALGELYPSKKRAMKSDRKIMIHQETARSESMVHENFSNFFGSFCNCDISRTLIV